MKTLLGVLSAMIDLRLAVSSRCSRRSHSRYSAPRASSPSSFIERSDHFWSKCTET